MNWSGLGKLRFFMTAVKTNKKHHVVVVIVPWTIRLQTSALCFQFKSIGMEKRTKKLYLYKE